MLGTGAAMVTKCYNTCFTLSDETGEHFLVDGGGGNGLLVQLEKAGIKPHAIHHAFISHNHSDHILGLVWLVRAVTQEINKGRYIGDLTIYGHRHSLDALRAICTFVMQTKLSAHFGQRVKFQEITDGDSLEILSRKVEFFDIGSRKEQQYGFMLTLHSGRKLAFMGDEPIHDCMRERLQGVNIIMQEAYCLYADREVFNPYPKSHGTVVDSCRNARDLGADTTILFHTEGRSLPTRKARYTAEAKTIFNGKIYVPEDLEVIDLE